MAHKTVSDSAENEIQFLQPWPKMSGFFAIGILAAKKKNIAAEQIACIIISDHLVHSLAAAQVRLEGRDFADKKVL